MQRDVLWLLSGMTLGLGVVGLSGCDDAPRGQAASSAKAPILASGLARPLGSDGEAAHPPSGRWCGAPPLAEGMRFLGSPDVDGCPKFLDGGKMPDGKDSSPEYVELPRSSRAFFDEVLTKMRRADINHAPLCCYNWHEKTPGGRPLVSGDQALTAGLISDLAPLNNFHPESIEQLQQPPEALRERLVQHWLEQAQLEHASIASFARARLELLSLGAPRELLQAYIQAARDELDHTQVCLGVAQSWGAPRTRLGALYLPHYDRSQVPAMDRQTALTALAANTLDEAFEPEASAALGLYRASQRATCPALGALLSQVAHDERRHAAIALATLRWCHTQGVRLPAPSAARAQDTQASPAAGADPPHLALSSGALWGEIDTSEWQALRGLCRAELIDPCLRQLA